MAGASTLPLLSEAQLCSIASRMDSRVHAAPRLVLARYMCTVRSLTLRTRPTICTNSRAGLLVAPPHARTAYWTRFSILLGHKCVGYPSDMVNLRHLYAYLERAIPSDVEQAVMHVTGAIRV